MMVTKNLRVALTFMALLSFASASLCSAPQSFKEQQEKQLNQAAAQAKILVQEKKQIMHELEELDREEGQATLILFRLAKAHEPSDSKKTIELQIKLNAIKEKIVHTQNALKAKQNALGALTQQLATAFTVDEEPMDENQE